MNVKTLFRAMRGPFLILSPVCIFLGASTVISAQGAVDLASLALALLGGLLAHISVNTLNEYYDFKSGLDFTTQKTSFSGGSGALPQNPDMASAVFATGIISLLATFAIGMLFVWQGDLAIIPVGIIGLLVIVTYTQWLNKHPFACLLAPGLGFGLLMVPGTQFVLSHEFSITALLASLVVFFLVNNLLLLNQYPDSNADASAGRRHLIIVHGIMAGNRVYAIFISAVVIILLTGLVSGLFPQLSLMALLPIPLALFALRGAIKYGAAIGQHPQYLAANVAVTLLVPLLLAIAFVAT